MLLTKQQSPRVQLILSAAGYPLTLPNDRFYLCENIRYVDSSGGSRSSSKGGDLYISYLGLPGVRYLAGLSGILDLYPV